MAAIRGKDTKPEMAVRRLLHALGYRYRLHRKDLPGKPDIVLPGRRKAIEIRGCWWHRHPDPCCPNVAMPKTRVDFWSAKFEANVARDHRNEVALHEMGWDLLILWECEVKALESLADRLTAFLGPVNFGANRCP
jgi:DNA mismatch endonuclease (patch repair protein)